MGRRRTLRAGAPRLSVSRSLRARLSTAVLEMLSEGIAAKRGRYGAYLHRDRVNRRCARAAAPARGHHQRRRDSRNAPVHRRRRAGRRRGRHARRGLRRREQRGRHHAAGQHVVADSPRRSKCGTRAGRRCPWRAAHRSLLAGRGARPHRGALRARRRAARRRSASCCRHLRR